MLHTQTQDREQQRCCYNLPLRRELSNGAEFLALTLGVVRVEDEAAGVELLELNEAGRGHTPAAVAVDGNIATGSGTTP